MKKLISLFLSIIIILTNSLLFNVYGDITTVGGPIFSKGEGTADNPFQISTAEDLSNIRQSLSSYFIQVNDIDLSSVENWEPIGNSSNPFTGHYDGMGFTIKNLTVTKDTYPNNNNSNTGLFGYTEKYSLAINSSIKNLNLSGATITSSKCVGSIIGYSNNTNIENCSSKGNDIVGYTFIGGLIGVAKHTNISKSYFTGHITSENLSNSITGGLAGYTLITNINESFSNSNINSGQTAGGLVGDHTGIIRNSYSSGKIIGTSNTGGLVGVNQNKNSSYSSEHDSIINCYSKMLIDASNYNPGGLVGNTKDNVKTLESFWDIDLSNVNTSQGGEGLSSISMKSMNTYIDAGWDFENIWSIYENSNEGYPYLINTSSKPTPKYITYTENHYIQNLSKDGYELYSSTNSSDIAGSEVYIDSINIEGFKENESHKDRLISSVLSQSGNLNLKRFYDREEYQVVFKDYDSSIIETKRGVFQGSVNPPPNPKREGYKFVEWIGDYSNLDSNVNITASYIPNDSTIYNVNHYKESLDGKYVLTKSEKLSGTTDTTATAGSLNYDGFILNTDKSITSGNITPDGSLYLSLYYDRIFYTVTFKDHDGSIIETQYISFEDDAVPPQNTVRTYYYFIGWSKDFSNITSDAVIEAIYEKKNTNHSKNKNNKEKEEIDNKIEKIDIPSIEGHWSKKSVVELVKREVIVNTDDFQPEEKITRAKFADYITRALGIYEKNSTDTTEFFDIDDDYELSDSIKSAIKYGIIKGYEDGTFKPNRTISRQEAMVMYSRAMKVLDLQIEYLKSIDNYDDSSQVGEWAVEDIKRVVSSGIFKGTGEKTLSPLSTLKYGEAAEAINNLIFYSGKWSYKE